MTTVRATNTNTSEIRNNNSHVPLQQLFTDVSNIEYFLKEFFILLASLPAGYSYAVKNLSLHVLNDKFDLQYTTNHFSQFRSTMYASASRQYDATSLGYDLLTKMFAPTKQGVGPYICKDTFAVKLVKASTNREPEYFSLRRKTLDTEFDFTLTVPESLLPTTEVPPYAEPIRMSEDRTTERSVESVYTGVTTMEHVVHTSINQDDMIGLVTKLKNRGSRLGRKEIRDIALFQSNFSNEVQVINSVLANSDDMIKKRMVMHQFEALKAIVATM